MRRNGKPEKTQAQAYDELRRRLFAYDSKSLGLELTRTEPFGAVMELGMSGAVITFMALLDGTVSMYVRGGMSVIGAGTHEPAREAGFRFIEAAKEHAASMEASPAHPMPGEGRVRFYLLRDAGVLATEIGMPNDPNEPLPPLFVAGNELITEIRLASAKYEEMKKPSE